MTIARLGLVLAVAAAAFLSDVSAPLARESASSDLGVLDGVIRSVDGEGMFVDIHYRTGSVALQRIDFGPHMLFGTARLTTTPFDLVPGRAIGMVIQRQRVGPMRALRVWLD